jgi:hypothetical protein
MKISLIELVQFSGRKAHFYTVAVNDDEKSLFQHFVEDNRALHKEEIDELLMRIKAMGETTGAREHFFKLNEGKPDDSVVALYDLPAKHLRLYCLRLGSCTVILGNGGPKNTRTYNEDKNLNNKVKLLQKISKLIDENIRSKDVQIDENGAIYCNDEIIDDYEDD